MASSAARRPGFDPAAWNGERPLVEPAPTVIDVGCVVWEDAPGDAQHDRRGGIVVGVRLDEETGERTLTVLRASMRNGRFSVNTFEVDASSVDPDAVEGRKAHRLHRAAREICRALGERPGGFIAGFDRYLLEVAVGLVVTAEDDVRGVSDRLGAA